MKLHPTIVSDTWNYSDVLLNQHCTREMFANPFQLFERKPPALNLSQLAYKTNDFLPTPTPSYCTKPLSPWDDE